MTRRSHSQLWTFAVIWAVVMAGTSSWLVDMPQGSEAVLALLILTVCCAGIAHSLREPFRPLLCLFFTFNLCWIGLASVYQLSHGLAAWGDSGITQDAPDVIRAQVLDLVAVSAFLIGYLVHGLRRTTAPPAVDAAPDVLGPDDARRRMRFAKGLLGLAFLLLPVVVVSAGGVTTLFSSRGGLDSAQVAAGLGTSAGGGAVALVKIIPGTAALLAALLAISVLKATRGTRPRRSAGRAARRGGGRAARRGSGRARPRRAAPAHRAPWVVLVLALALTVCFANPLANTRYIFIDAFGSIILYALAPRSRRAGVAVFGVAVIALLVAYPLANVFRQGINSSTGVTYSSSHELASDDFDGFQQIVNSEIFVHDDGHSFGRYTASAALVFVPRSVWHSKATPASIDVAANRNYRFTNLSLPVQAELFIDFGLGGMGLVMLGLGLVWSRLDTAWRAGGHWEVLVAYFALAQLGVIRGPLGSLSPVYGLATVLLLIAIGRPLRHRRAVIARRRARGVVSARQARARRARGRRLRLGEA